MRRAVHFIIEDNAQCERAIWRACESMHETAIRSCETIDRTRALVTEADSLLARTNALFAGGKCPSDRI